ncbi:hypothetical protein L3V83_04175 [Thiotrichales bacterium 19X7-9]|nr:hypothetical protein [Thiotrichales bacterium 19X7-9]
MKHKISKLVFAALSLSMIGYSNANANPNYDYDLAVSTYDGVATIDSAYSIDVELDAQLKNIAIGTTADNQASANNIQLHFNDKANNKHFDVKYDHCGNLSVGKECKISITPKKNAQSLVGKDIKYTITTTVDSQKLKANNDFSVKSPTLDISLPAFTQMLQTTCHSDDIKCKKAVKEAYAEAPLAFKQMLQATIFSVCGTPAGDNKPWCKGFSDKSNKSLTEISPDSGKHGFIAWRKNHPSFSVDNIKQWCNMSNDHMIKCIKADDIITRIGPVFIVQGLMQWRKHHHGMQKTSPMTYNDTSFSNNQIIQWCKKNQKKCSALNTIGVVNIVLGLNAWYKSLPEWKQKWVKHKIKAKIKGDPVVPSKNQVMQWCDNHSETCKKAYNASMILGINCLLLGIIAYHKSHDGQVINSMNYYTKANI